ncbi:putative reverse transcriptase domain-containing protein, partial [Tanacetum coccineum]
SSSETSSDSSCDSPTTISARPSRKRRRPPTTSVPAASPVPGALSPVRADLLSPCKRIRDSDFVTDFKVSSEEGFLPYVPREISLGVDVEDSYEPYTEPDIDPDVQADIDTCIMFVDDIAARGIDVRVEDGTAAEEEAKSSARGTIEIGVDQVTHLVISEDTAKPVREDYPDLVSADGSLEVIQRGLDMVMQELYDHMSDAMSERIGTLEQDNMRLKGMLDVKRQRVDRLRCSMSTMPTATHSEMTQDAINELISKRVAEALEAYDAARNPRTETKMEDEQQDDNVEVNGNNGNGNSNGNGNPNVNNEGVVPITREFTYQDFVKCQSLNFKGIEGVVGLTRWFEKMETVFHISNFPLKYQVKFQELTLLCTKMVPEEEDQVEKYIGGLPDNIQENKLKGYAVRNAENKRRKVYAGNLPYCNKCKRHYEGPCTVKCGNCKRVGHMSRYCKAAVTATAQRAPVGNQTSVTCYECGRQGHYRSECPKLRNQNRRNKTWNNEAKAKAYAIGGGGASPDSNVVTGIFLLNNHYASMLFDSGADRSFVLTTFSALLDVIPSTLDVSYAI